MTLYLLPFAKITLIREDLAEVVINEGVEINMEMLNQYHDFLLNHLRPPFSLLINKINTYSYTFDAQAKLATLKEINAIGVVAYNRVTLMALDSLASFPREVKWNMKAFTNYDDALSWVMAEQEKVLN